jgi:periplasmic divalent cation tolerance protein
MEDIFLVYITVSGQEEAEKLAGMVLSEKLAACVNIHDHVKSLYLWEGSLERTEETVMVVKTTASHVKKLTRKVKEAHSYDLPCILAFPVKYSDKDYSEWVLRETLPI